MYHLIMAHGGWTADGRLLGVPIVNTPENANSNFNQPRNTFQECIDQIMNDANTALGLLPLDYGDVVEANIPEKYKTLGVTNAGDYNRVNGNIMRGRITARIVEAIKAQVALLAASPAYSAGTNVTWATAADNAAIVLDRIGGVIRLS